MALLLVLMPTATAIGPPAGATVAVQQRALDLGYPAGNCSYCHVFDSDHMMRKARDLGLPMQRLDCLLCHGAKLPKPRNELFNDRGRWLLAQKERRRAQRVDPAWLTGYHEPQAARRPGPRSSASPDPHR